MPSVCLNTAMSITGLSKRTLWRRIGEGRLTTRDTRAPGEQTRLALDDVLALSHLALGPQEHALIVAADQGERAAQCELGLLLLNANRAANALYWFDLAAKQYDPNAMCYLGRCYLACDGVEPDQDAGMLWIGQAAAKGHQIAQALMLFLQSPKGQQLLERQEPKALETALDAVEREVMLKALSETADPASAER